MQTNPPKTTSNSVPNAADNSSKVDRLVDNKDCSHSHNTVGMSDRERDTDTGSRNTGFDTRRSDIGNTAVGEVATSPYERRCTVFRFHSEQLAESPLSNSAGAQKGAADRPEPVPEHTPEDKSVVPLAQRQLLHKTQTKHTTNYASCFSFLRKTSL